ncbi:MAG: GDYXXLXY domain-containing protein [Litorimonas sp.]
MIRIALVIFGLLLCGWRFTTGFVAAETIRVDGEEVLFKLAPVDPRELFLGDYMVLNYDLGLTLRNVGSDTIVIPDKRMGVAVIRVQDGVGTIIRFDLIDELATNERLIAYTRPTDWRPIRIGGDRYYFQSGTGERYADAEYAIFRVMPDGRALLSGLADEKKRPILIAGEAPLKVVED